MQLPGTQHDLTTADLFSGIPVRDDGPAAAWCERLLGAPPSFLPNDTEAVWDSPTTGTCTSQCGPGIGQQVACPADAGVQVGQEGVQRRPLRLDGGAEVEL